LEQISVNLPKLVKKLPIFILFLVLSCVSFAQIHNRGNIYINSGENVYIQGYYNNETSGRLQHNGTIHIKGDWNNNDASALFYTNLTGGLVRMVGTSMQNFGGTTASTFNNLEVANAAHVNLNKNVTVRQVLTFTNGKIITNSNYMIITNTLPAAMTGYDANKYIVGNLRRHFTGTATDFDLPIGTMGYYELATVRFNSYSGITYLDSRYTQSTQTVPFFYPSLSAIYVYPDVMNPVADPLANYLSKWSHIYEFLNYGYWTITPDAMTSANYKLTANARGHSNGGLIPGQHALIKRANGSSPWGAQGIYPFGSQVGSGAGPVIVYMDQMSTFSDFIVGKSQDNFGPLAIVLTSFDAKCEASRVHLTWSTANEEKNDYFTIERSKNLYSWEEVTRVDGSELSQGNLDYEAFDVHPYPGISYYRLKQTDLDGTTTIFGDQWLRYSDCGFEGEFDVKIYADFDDNILVNFTAFSGEKYSLNIYDPSGRIVLTASGSANEGLNTLTVPVQVQDGLYFVNFRNESSQKSEKIVLGTSLR